MSKKLGIILLFAGAYITLIAGLLWVMPFTSEQVQHPWFAPHDWAYGLGIAIILIIGAVFAAKGYISGFIGIGITAVGIALDFVLLAYGLKENYFSVVLLVGIIFSIVGVAVTTVFHILNMRKIAKYGNSLLK